MKFFIFWQSGMFGVVNIHRVLRLRSIGPTKERIWAWEHGSVKKGAFTSELQNGTRGWQRREMSATAVK